MFLFLFFHYFLNVEGFIGKKKKKKKKKEKTTKQTNEQKKKKKKKKNVFFHFPQASIHSVTSKTKKVKNGNPNKKSK